MQLNRTQHSALQPWSFNDYDFLDNQTSFCPLKSSWIHLEDYFITSLGLIILCLLTVRIHLTERRFHDLYARIRCYIMSLTLMVFLLASIPFHWRATESSCQLEQILLQYSSIICLTNLFLISLLRLVKLKLSSICLLFLLAVSLQTLFTSLWFYRKHPAYSRVFCYHRIQIHLCLHGIQPVLLSTVFIPVISLLTAYNVYHFTRPFAIAQFLEAIISLIGLLLMGSMWYMSLLFSNYPQIPYRYVACVFLLTYMLPRIWISELERSKITVEEIRPLLHEEIRYQNENCAIRFNDDEDEGEEEEEEEAIDRSISCPKEPKSKTMIRTSEMSPGEIFSSILDKYEAKPNAYL